MPLVEAASGFLLSVHSQRQRVVEALADVQLLLTPEVAVLACALLLPLKLLTYVYLLKYSCRLHHFFVCAT